MQFPKKFEKIRAHERDFMSYAIAGQKRNMTLVVLNKYLNYVANFQCLSSNELCNHFCWGLLFAANVAIKV